MTGPCPILEFPTGRRMDASDRPPADTVARLVRCLGGRGTTAPLSANDRPMLIELRTLAGVDDDTIGGLADFASAGMLKPVCAARLALRHTAETHSTLPGRLGPTASEHFQVTKTIAGDVFGDYAFRFQHPKCWLDFTSKSGIHHLFEICPSDRNTIYMLIGCDRSGRYVVWMITPPDWRARLAYLRGASRDAGVHQVLLVRGLPSVPAERTIVVQRLRTGFDAAGNIAIGRRGSKTCPQPRNSISAATGAEVLTLIEMAMPGLSQAPTAPTGRASMGLR